EKIRLRADVEMNLWVDARSGFLMAGSGTAEKKPAESVRPQANDAKETAPPEKAKVLIITQGPFTYDLRTDHAVFETAHNTRPRPNFVTVDRVHQSDGKVDHLQCEQLELQFHRQSANAPSGNASAERKSDGLDIEVARATGKDVILKSDADVLEAHGNDFAYDRRTKLSTLRGNPKMTAIKEGTLIEAAELQLLDQKGSQQATALGEGHIDLMERDGRRPLEAHWKKKLVYTKEANQDILILYGDAVFKDKEHDQQIQAEILKVWLEPSGPAPARDGDQQRRKPQHLDAVEHVRVAGPEIRIRDAEHLVIWFRDAPLTGTQLPPVPGIGPQGNDQPGAARTPGGPQELLPSVKNDFPGVSGKGQSSPSADASKAKKPIDLTAHYIKADVLRSANKNDLEKLHCEGLVHVHQDPATPEEKGVDIHGEVMELDHHVDGNELVVEGDMSNNATVQLNQVYIVAPAVKM